MIWRAMAMAAAFGLASCATAPAPTPTPAPTPAGPAAAAEDAQAQFESYRAQVEANAARVRDLMMRARGPAMALYAADLEFNDDARERGLQKAFSERFTDDGKLIGAGAPIAVGPAAVAAAYADSEQMSLIWSPVEAVVDGDLGVTWGIAALRFVDDKGVTHARSTRYVTVWRKVDDVWKIWIDTGTSGPLPSPAP